MERGKLRRYTDTLSVLDVLWRRHIVLLDPKLWDDKNDSFYIEEYARRSGYAAVMALCLTAESETYHHWSVFARHSGACIVFKRAAFVQQMQQRRYLCRPVTYRTNPQMASRIGADADEDLPFLKRYAFRHEKEHRVVFGSTFSGPTHEIPITLDLIDRIVLSPWTPQSLYLSFKSIVNAIPGCEELWVTRSLLIDNATWRDALTASVAAI